MTVWNNPAFVKQWNETYGLTMDGETFRGLFVFPWFRENIGDFTNKKLLDLGCGNGNLIRHFKNENFAQWVGVDAGGAVLDSSKADLAQDPRITLLHQDACQSLAINGEMDVVSSFFVVEEIPLELITGYWQTAHDCLKPGGVVFAAINHPAKAMHYYDAAKHAGIENKKFPGHGGYFDRTKNKFSLQVMNIEQGVQDKAVYYQKTMGDILTSAAQAGLKLETCEELARSIDSYADRYKQPEPGDHPSLLLLTLRR